METKDFFGFQYLPPKLLIREQYNEAWDLFCDAANKPLNGIVVTGNPGIGKRT